MVKRTSFIAILLFHSLLSFSQTIGVTENSYQKIGPVYTVTYQDKHQELLTILERKEVSSKTTYHYFLQLMDIHTASVLKQKEIAITNDQPIDHEQFIGRMGDVFWVITDSLAGYNETSLEIAVTENNIVEKNPFMKNNFSRHHNSYLLDESAQVMYVGTENGDRYKLYPKALLMKPDTSNSDLGAEDFSYEFAAEYKINDRYQLKFAVTGVDTLKNRMYLLGSQKEISNMLSYSGSTIYSNDDESRQLTILLYNASGEKVDYAKNKPITGKINYYKAAFVLKKFSPVAWRSNSEERIIVYHSDKTSNASLSFAMIDANGKEKWTVNTGLFVSDFRDYLLFNNELLVWFDSRQKGTGKQQSRFISIAMADGQISSYTYGQ